MLGALAQFDRAHSGTNQIERAASKHKLTLLAGRLNLAIDEIHIGRANETSDIGVDRAAVNVVGRANLLQHAVFHDRNAAAQRHGLNLVVRHIHAGDARDMVQALDLGAHLYAQFGI